MVVVVDAIVALMVGSLSVCGVCVNETMVVVVDAIVALMVGSLRV